MPNEPDDLTFAELRLANLLHQRTSKQAKREDIADILARIVIIIDALAAREGINLAEAIRKQFAPETQEQSDVLEDQT